MRLRFTLVFIILLIALGVCRIVARRSKKIISPAVDMLLASLMPPVLGNMLIVASSAELISTIGYYIYFLGMNFVMLALLRFTIAYCRIEMPQSGISTVLKVLFSADILQYMVNPFLKQAFETEAIMVDGAVYYQLIPHLGQTFHRILDYSILIGVIIIFFVKTVKTPRIYAERYSALLVTMVAVTVWETFYIFSRNSIDRSMIGFAFFGLLVFYFALYYRPMRLLDRMLANVASDMPDALFFFDAIGRCIWANAPGIALADIKNEDFESASDRLIAMFDLSDLKMEGPLQRIQRTARIGDSDRHFVLEKHIVTDDHNRVTGSFLTVRDNTEEQHALEKQKYIARHDVLTGLYTREYLYRRIREIINNNSGTNYCVVFVDVNNFKVINDIYGSEFGNHALKCLADWVRRTFSKNAVYGRIAGDMFGACLPVAEFNAERIENELINFSIKDGKVELPLLVHLGVYVINETELDVSVMFDRARMALTTIKDDFQTHIAYYDDNMRDKVLWDQMISSKLHYALANRQVHPYLQPVVDTHGNVVGAEALVRWKYPIEGLLAPGSFIPVFERNGMIAEIDKYMWRCACEILARWQEKNINMFISVNISPKDFYFMDVASEIKSIAAEYGIDPSKLRVEITESAMMDDIDNRVKVLYNLKNSGFVVEMDDFGSGFSSLNMLKEIPVEIIKLDMVFLKKSKNDNKAKKILNHIVKLSDDLGVTSLTEGVETEDQYRMLIDMGCKLFQGYYFAKPMPIDEFESFCKSRM